ncbi:MAG: helix-turn-helix transcriptional regulator [Ktedonobacteraceae bacterium]
MVMPRNKPIVCPVVIGRTIELTAIHELIESTKSGQGQVVVLSGEAGIGKSRLVKEAKAYATSMNFRVVQGNCFPTDLSCPYAPILDLIRTLLAHSDSTKIQDMLKPFVHDLYPLLPDVLPSITDLNTAQPNTVLEPEQEKRRIFTALVHCFTGLSMTEPLMLIIEDLHWSDDTSLEFLHYLARHSTDHPLLLLMTYRSDELRPALRSWLAQLDRERLAHEYLLSSFSRNDVDTMLQAIFGVQRRVPAETLDALYGLTEGNPFFIEEILKSLIMVGGIFYTDENWEHKPLSELHIPRSIQDAVQQRTDQLSKDAKHILTLAAVAGRRFDFALLQELTHHDEQQLLILMKELIAAQLVIEESAEHFAFRHALTRQAVYAELLARERKALHLTIAETIESFYISTLDIYVADLSYHFYEAGAWEKALKYAKNAGEKALALFAPHAAIDHYTRALSSLYNLAITPPPEMFRKRGQAYVIQGEFEHARSDFELSLDIARSHDDRRAEWEAQLNLGMLWTERDYERSGEYYQHAFELAQTMNEPSMLAHSLNRLGNWYLNLEHPNEALEHHQKALTIFEALHNKHGIAETLDLLGMTSYLGCDLTQGTIYYKQAVALFRELDDRQGLTSSLATLTMRGPTYQTDTMVSAATSLADVIPDGEMALKIAQEIGQRSAEAYAYIFLGVCLGAKGDYSRALEFAQKGLEIAEEIEHQQWIVAAHCALGATYRELLALSLAQQHLEKALLLANKTCSLHWIRTATGHLASTYVLQKEHTRADSILNAAIDANTPSQTLGQRLAWCARAELALSRKEPSQALQIIEQIMTSGAHSGESRAIPRLARLRGEALTALNRASEAEEILKHAKITAQQQEALPLLWRIHLALGKCYQTQRRYEAAEESLLAARDIIEQLATNVPGESLRSDFLEHTHTQLSIMSPSPQRAAKRAYDGLTAREREIAERIARGQSSREMAEVLVISERTVETHIGNILSKLGYNARTQIAVWVTEKGLMKKD